jgi:hypothetical protein
MKRRLPKSNTGYWLPKLEGNRARDIENDCKLAAAGMEGQDDLGSANWRGWRLPSCGHGSVAC